MNTDLPIVEHFEDFYIWFNKEEKQEYYSTPLYFYKADFSIEFNDKEKNAKTGRKTVGKRTLKWKENEKTDNGLKHPASIYFPFEERLGTLLVRFLNADLSDYETAYKDFFYSYGFEILRDVDKDYKFTLSNNYGNDETYLKETKKIYDNLKEQLIYIQENIKDAVDYIYNVDEKEELKAFTHSQRYAVYLIKRMGKLYSYIKNDNVILDNYSNKYDELRYMSENELLSQLKENGTLISMSNTHKSNDISSICYAILSELSKVNNYPIKRCQNCKMYFIPISKVDEVYCDYPKPNGKTCRDLGAFQSYTERLKQNKAMGEYRRMYQQKFQKLQREKGNKELAKDFEIWKKQAKEKMKLLKNRELTEDEVYNWLLKNK